MLHPDAETFPQSIRVLIMMMMMMMMMILTMIMLNVDYCDGGEDEIN